MSLFLISLFIISTGIFGLGRYVNIANSFKENENASKFFIKVQFGILHIFFTWMSLWAMMVLFKLCFSGLSWMPGFGGSWSLLVIMGVIVALVIAGLGTIVQMILIPMLYIVYKTSIYFTSKTYVAIFNYRKGSNYCFDSILSSIPDTGNKIEINV